MSVGGAKNLRLDLYCNIGAGYPELKRGRAGASGLVLTSIVYSRRNSVNSLTTKCMMAAGLMTIPVLILHAGTDSNGDGCVDLKDFAILQANMNGPDCSEAAGNSQCADHSIASFFVEGVGELEIVSLVPGVTGFVVTDVLIRTVVAESVELKSSFGGPTETLAKFWGEGPGRSFHLQSGVVLPAGAQVFVDTGSALMSVTISGYTN